MYELKSVNLSHLGGPMGSEYTTTNWRRYFKTLKGAKNAADKDYGKKIDWKKTDGEIHSGDLLYVKYEIKELAIED
jgi:hypothetical protein